MERFLCAIHSKKVVVPADSVGQRRRGSNLFHPSLSLLLSNIGPLFWHLPYLTYPLGKDEPSTFSFWGKLNMLALR